MIISQNIQLLSFGTTPACSAPDDIPTVSVSLESEVFLTMPILQINKIFEGLQIQIVQYA